MYAKLKILLPHCTRTLIASFALLFFSGCNLGFVSFGGGKGNLFKGEPAPADPLAPVPAKFVLEINGQASAVVPFALGFCSAPIKVVALSKSGELAKVRARTEIQISGVSATKLFGDESCSMPLPVKSGFPFVDIHDGQSETQFYMKDAEINNSLTQPREFTVIANSPGYQESPPRSLRVDRTLVGLRVGEAPFNTGAALVGGGRCQEMKVWGVDGIGEAFFSGPSVTVTLGGAGSGAFYMNSGCTAATTSVSLNNANGAIFFYKNDQVNQSINLFTTNSMNLRNAARSVSTISVPVRLRFRAPLPTANVASLCQNYTVDFFDSSGGTSSFGSANSAITIAAKLVSGGTVGNLYSGDGCTGATTTTINPAQTTETFAKFSFKANTSIAHGNSVYFEVSKSGLVGDSTLSTPLVVSTEVRKVTITGSMAVPRLGLCNGTSPLAVNVFDGRTNGASENPYNRGTTITLSTTPVSSNRRFYSDKYCTNEYSSGEINIPNGTNTASFYYLDTTTASPVDVTITATGPAMTGGGNADAEFDLTLQSPLSLDSGFGSSGALVRSIGSNAVIRSFVGAANNRYVAVGTTGSGNASRLTVARVNANGSLDNTFSGDGFETVSLSSLSQTAGYGALVDGTSTFAVGSGLNDSVPADPITEFIVVKLGNTGSVSKAHRGTFSATAKENVATAITKVGSRYVVAGYAVEGGTKSFGVAVFNDDLDLVSSFNSGGLMTFAFSAGAEPRAMTALDTQNVLVVGNTSNSMVVAKFNTTSSSSSPSCNSTTLPGSLSSFSVTAAAAALVGSNTMLYAAARSQENDLYLFRLKSDCQVDTSYGSSGYVTDTSTRNDTTLGMAVYADVAGDPDSNKIVLAGSRDTGGNKSFFVSRYARNGAPDSSNYTRERDLGSSNDEAAGVILLSGGKIILGGTTGSSPGLAQFLR